MSAIEANRFRKGYRFKRNPNLQMFYVLEDFEYLPDTLFYVKSLSSLLYNTALRINIYMKIYIKI